MQPRSEADLQKLFESIEDKKEFLRLGDETGLLKNMLTNCWEAGFWFGLKHGWFRGMLTGMGVAWLIWFFVAV